MHMLMENYRHKPVAYHYLNFNGSHSFQKKKSLHLLTSSYNFNIHMVYTIVFIQPNRKWQYQINSCIYNPENIYYKTVTIQSETYT